MTQVDFVGNPAVSRRSSSSDNIQPQRPLSLAASLVLPILAGPLVWFGLPFVVARATYELQRLLRPDSFIGWVVDRIQIEAAGLTLGSMVFAVLLIPAMAIAAIMLRKGWLSWTLWGPGAAGIAVVLPYALVLFDSLLGHASMTAASLAPFTLRFALGGFVYGLAFRGIVAMARRVAGSRDA